MSPEAVIAVLRAHEIELRAAGVTRLALFGSTARDEARADSDVDLLAAFDNERDLSLIDVIRIENLIADLLGQPVDLIEKQALKPQLRQRVMQELVSAF
jgi:predicted nucleotidyltransferase